MPENTMLFLREPLACENGWKPHSDPQAGAIDSLSQIQFGAVQLGYALYQRQAQSATGGASGLFFGTTVKTGEDFLAFRDCDTGTVVGHFKRGVIFQQFDSHCHRSAALRVPNRVVNQIAQQYLQ